jgi:putative ABC transport system permease protein
VTEKTQWFTVIGVVGEVKLRGLVEGVGDTGAFYRVQAQTPLRGLTFVVRTASDPTSLATAVRETFARVDRELPVFNVQTMAERTDRSLATRRTPMLLSLAFGFIALFLAAVGIYGVLAYVVTQRRKEIGIRIALGSSTAAVLRLVLREGLVLIAGGFVLGAAGAVAVRRSLESQLFGVRAADPVVLALAFVTLGTVAVAACVLPARRATRIDPVIALAE